MATSPVAIVPCTSLAPKGGLHEHVKEGFTVYVTRFTLIDTAEDRPLWQSRAQKEWGGGQPLFIQLNTKSFSLGRTAPKVIEFRRSFSGVCWDGVEGGIAISSLEDTIFVLEVRGAEEPERVLGVGLLMAQSVVAESRQFAKFCVHILPMVSAMDTNTVHAVAEVEIHSSLLHEVLEPNFTPLEYNFGSVRVSTVDFYYPPFLLSGTGQYIVSNVMCAMNMTESSSLAFQLMPLGESGKYISVEPAQVITVRPQRRVYFSATWNVAHPACMKPMEMQLVVNGSEPVSAPIMIKVHSAIPQPTTTDVPYQYWVNTTCIKNRQMLFSQEFPLVRSILPVYRFVTHGLIDQSEELIVAFDRDKGEHVLLRADGMPTLASRRVSNTRWDGIHEVHTEDSSMKLLDYLVGDDKNAQALVSELMLDANAFASRGPLLNLSQKTCLCTIVLGTIRGFPMVFESSTGVSPSFQISVTLLDQRGWQVVRGETRPSYQSASGNLRWNEQLELRKWPGANPTQFVRLNLTEVRPRDGDETPIGAGLLSLGRLDHIYGRIPLSVAFYVYETYSLYDQLNSSSLLMKEAMITFSDVR